MGDNALTVNYFISLLWIKCWQNNGEKEVILPSWQKVWMFTFDRYLTLSLYRVKENNFENETTVFVRYIRAMFWDYVFIAIAATAISTVCLVLI